MDVIGIPNASHWLNNSTVVVKEDYTAADEAWIMNNLVRLDAANTVELTGKHHDIVFLKRLVQPGSVVAVKRANGRTKLCNLPQEIESLLWNDLQYIVEQINRLNEPPMTEEEQQAFQPPVSESSQAI